MGRAGARVLEVVLLVAIVSVAVMGVARPLLGPGGLGIGRGPVFGQVPSITVTLDTTVRTEPALPTVDGGTFGPGEALEFSGPFRADVSVFNPDWRQRLGLIGPQILGGLVTVGVLGLLLLIVRSLWRGDPFRTGNARLLLGIAAMVGIGGQSAVFLSAWGRAGALNHERVAPYVQYDAYYSFMPLLAGLGIAVAAEVFRRGAQLREDVEGLV